MKAYKVVSYHPSTRKWQSAIILCGAYSIEYKPGEVTHPHPDALHLGYGILAFETKKAARSFMRFHRFPNGEYGCRFEIWECETPVEALLSPPQICQCCDVEDGLFDPLDEVYQWPDETIMLAEITLVKKVERGKLK